MTGEVDRTTEFEEGFPIHQALRGNGWEPDPSILDDQALVASVRGKGLVVLTGCGHSGIVNIMRYAQKLTGEPQTHAIVGGFHLSGGLFEKIIDDTAAALGDFNPDYVVPSHCTGFRATQALPSTFPDAFIQNSVGTGSSSPPAGSDDGPGARRPEQRSRGNPTIPYFRGLGGNCERTSNVASRGMPALGRALPSGSAAAIGKGPSPLR